MRKRLLRLLNKFCKHQGIKPIRLRIFRDCNDPTGTIQGMYEYKKRVIWVRLRSSYRRQRKVIFTWNYVRGILAHELAHSRGASGGSLLHVDKHKRATRRVGRILTKLERS